MEEAIKSYWQFWPEKKGCGGNRVYRTKVWPWCLKNELITLHFWIRAIESPSVLPQHCSLFSHSLSSTRGKSPSSIHNSQLFPPSLHWHSGGRLLSSVLCFCCWCCDSPIVFCQIMCVCVSLPLDQGLLEGRSQMEIFALCPLGFSCFWHSVDTL